jgi:hypothetical protein
MDLTDEEVRQFAEACADPSHLAVREVMLAAGANSASGVLARILLATGPDRQRLIELVRSAIK